MITLLDKQKIILKHHHDGKSQRAIHRETGISRKTIRKYIKEYESKKAALFDSRNIPDGELIQSIVEKPTYDSSSRKKTKLTPQIIERIEYYLQENETKRAIGRAKQQKKKIDIYEALIEEGFDISYPTICNTIRTMEKKLQPKNRKLFRIPRLVFFHKGRHLSGVKERSLIRHPENYQMRLLVVQIT
jgi:hypothetical protein